MTEYSKEQQQLLDSIEWSGSDIPTVLGMTATQIASNNAMAFLRRVIQLDNGNPAIHRDIVIHKPIAMLMVSANMEDGEKFLITREYRAGINDVSLGFPAGCIEDGEEPWHAALRELQEETGISVSNSQCNALFSKELTSSEGMTDELSHLYRIELIGYTTTEQKLDADERIQFTWVSWEQLQQLVNKGLIRDARDIALIQNEQLIRKDREIKRLQGIIRSTNRDKEEALKKLNVANAAIKQLEGQVRVHESDQARRNREKRLNRVGWGN